MKKLTIISILMFILLVTSVSATIDWTTDVDMYLPLANVTNSETGLLDLANSYDGTAYGGVTFFNSSQTEFDFDGTNDYIKFNYKELSPTDSYSISMWIKKASSSTYRTLISNIEDEGDTYLVSQMTDGGKFRFLIEGSSSSSSQLIVSTTSIDDNTYHLVTVTSDGTNIYLYVDDNLEDSATITESGRLTSTNDWTLGVQYKQDSSSFSAYYDDLMTKAMIFDKTLTITEITNLYNNGPNYNPYTVDTNVTITTDNTDYNITLISNETQTYNNVNLSQEVDILNTDTRFWNITLKATNNYNITYIDYNFSLNGSISTTFDLLKYNVTFKANNIITSDLVTNFNITIENGSIYSNSDTANLEYGLHNFTFSKAGYYNLSVLNQSINNNTQINFTDVYNAILNLTFEDVNTNTTINKSGNFTFEIDGINTTVTTTNGTFYIKLLKGNSSTLSLVTNYAYLYQNITIDDYLENLTLYLYASNSVWINALDLSDITAIENITVTIYNLLNSYNGTDDLVKINNITSGTYDVKVEKVGYTTGYYIITVGEGSHQDLTAYLSSTTSPITFNVQNLLSSVLIPDVTISIYYLINSSWVLTNSKDSDVTGRAQFNVDTDNSYKFNFAKTDFTTKEFILQPVFSDYTIKLTPTDFIDPSVDKGDYYVRINPYLVYTDQLNNITFDIVSGTGSLEYYNVTITSPVESKTGNYSSTYGGSYTYEINVSNTEIVDNLIVTYGVKEVGESYKTYTVLLSIQGDNINEDNTLWGFSNNLEGYGYFEKGIIATLIMLILLGVVASISQMTGGNTFVITGISLLVFSGIFVILDFIPTWTLYIIGFAFILTMFAKLRGE